jgi:cytoskeletal protein RodZ
MMMLSANEAKKLRPGLFTGLLLVMGIVIVQLIQLGLNMALTQDAYYLSKLASEKRQLSTEVQIIQEQVDSLASPQNLADAANQLGMVANPSAVLIDIVNDKIYGAPKPAQAQSGAASSNLVANSAMVTVSEFTASTVAAAEVETSVAAKSNNSSEVTLVAGQIPASPTR